MLNAVSNWKQIGVILPASVLKKKKSFCMASTVTYNSAQALCGLNVNLLKAWPDCGEGGKKICNMESCVHDEKQTRETSTTLPVRRGGGT